VKEVGRNRAGNCPADDPAVRSADDDQAGAFFGGEPRQRVAGRIRGEITAAVPRISELAANGLEGAVEVLGVCRTRCVAEVERAVLADAGDDQLRTERLRHRRAQVQRVDGGRAAVESGDYLLHVNISVFAP
jgi:hypothetical protein